MWDKILVQLATHHFAASAYPSSLLVSASGPGMYRRRAMASAGCIHSRNAGVTPNPASYFEWGSKMVAIRSPVVRYAASPF